MTVRPSLELGLPVIMMQCDDEVLDSTDPAMYCLELSGKKKSTILIMTLSIVAVITLSLKKYSSVWRTLACSRSET